MKQKQILLIIVIAQFMCTSVWFAINAIIPEMVAIYNIPTKSSNIFTSIIQFGFLVGTLVFAIWNISDRYSPNKVFMVCALLSGISNACLLMPIHSINSIAVLRFVTGICLAGIYPVGIKLAADHFKNDLGKALGLLVGTLVLGTAIPHFFNFIALKNSFYFVIGLTSLLSIIGGLLIGFTIPNNSTNKITTKFRPRILLEMFNSNSFKKVSFGYFGHMWELYTFWAFVPVFIGLFNKMNESNLNISLWSFVIIAVGFISCTLGGFVAEKYSSSFVAKVSLIGSFICCILFPFVLRTDTFYFIPFMIVWGMFVISDSPQLSALIAQFAPKNYKGTAITLVNCIGFSLTIISIQLLGYMELNYATPYIYLTLALGPLFGLFHLYRKQKNNILPNL